MIKSSSRLLPLLLLPVLSLIGCGGGGGGGGGVGAALTGTFVDDPVEGLRYSGQSHSGETDANGTFSYDHDGEFITFSVGDVEIGSGNARPVMTPVDLVNDEDPTAVDETNDRVTNIARFLQAIDDDGDPSNGIRVTQAVRDAAMGKSAEFNQTRAAFESDTNVLNLVADLTAATNAGPRDLVPLAEAQDRLRQTLLAELAGCYSGTYTGSFNEQSDHGTFAFTVDANGAVTGTFDSSVYTGPWPLSGEIGSGGAFVLTISIPVISYALPLHGTVSNHQLSGVWDADDSGTFTGNLGCSGG